MRIAFLSICSDSTNKQELTPLFGVINNSVSEKLAQILVRLINEV